MYPLALTHCCAMSRFERTEMVSDGRRWQRLNPDLAAIARGCAMPLDTQAGLAGFPHLSRLSEVLHAQRLIVTPLLEKRVHALAELLNFKGDLFVDAIEGDEVAR
jgi:hypothetical protein